MSRPLANRIPRAPLRWALSLSIAAGWGCGAIGGAGLVLKAPVAKQCETTGLKACDELTEGVLLVVEGKKADGLKQIGKAAGKNSPEEIKRFAAALKAVGSIPGASQYMGPVQEVIAYLDTSAEQRPASGGGPEASVALDGDGAPVVRHPRDVEQPSGPRVVLTADTDAQQRLTRMTHPARPDHAQPCGELTAATEARCTRVIAGPLIITDAIATSPACGIFLASVEIMSESKHARWKVDVAGSMHGAALLVPTGEALHVGVTSSDEACAVLWSGYVPYRATP